MSTPAAGRMAGPLLVRDAPPGGGAQLSQPPRFGCSPQTAITGTTRSAAPRAQRVGRTDGMDDDEFGLRTWRPQASADATRRRPTPNGCGEGQPSRWNAARPH